MTSPTANTGSDPADAERTRANDQRQSNAARATEARDRLEAALVPLATSTQDAHLGAQVMAVIRQAFASSARNGPESFLREAAAFISEVGAAARHAGVDATFADQASAQASELAASFTVSAALVSPETSGARLCVDLLAEVRTHLDQVSAADVGCAPRVAAAIAIFEGLLDVNRVGLTSLDLEAARAELQESARFTDRTRHFLAESSSLALHAAVEVCLTLVSEALIKDPLSASARLRLDLVTEVSAVLEALGGSDAATRSATSAASLRFAELLSPQNTVLTFTDVDTLGRSLHQLLDAPAFTNTLNACLGIVTTRLNLLNAVHEVVTTPLPAASNSSDPDVAPQGAPLIVPLPESVVGARRPGEVHVGQVMADGGGADPSTAGLAGDAAGLLRDRLNPDGTPVFVPDAAQVLQVKAQLEALLGQADAQTVYAEIVAVYAEARDSVVAAWQRVSDLGEPFMTRAAVLRGMELEIGALFERVHPLVQAIENCEVDPAQSDAVAEILEPLVQPYAAELSNFRIDATNRTAYQDADLVLSAPFAAQPWASILREQMPTVIRNLPESDQVREAVIALITGRADEDSLDPAEVLEPLADSLSDLNADYLDQLPDIIDSISYAAMRGQQFELALGILETISHYLDAETRAHAGVSDALDRAAKLADTVLATSGLESECYASAAQILLSSPTGQALLWERLKGLIEAPASESAMERGQIILTEVRGRGADGIGDYAAGLKALIQASVLQAGAIDSANPLAANAVLAFAFAAGPTDLEFFRGIIQHHGVRAAFEVGDGGNYETSDGQLMRTAITFLGVHGERSDAAQLRVMIPKDHPHYSEAELQAKVIDDRNRGRFTRILKGSGAALRQLVLGRGQPAVAVGA